LSREGFAWHIGLTPNTYWKRAQAWRVLKQYPQIGTMVENGETCVSHVAMLAAKITSGNASVLIEGLRNKSTRELRDFIATVNPDGSIRPSGDAIVEIKLRLSVAEAQLIERAREVLAHAAVKAHGTMPTEEEVVVKALNLLLERKDPMRKAERAAKTSASMQDAPAPKPAHDCDHDCDHDYDHGTERKNPATQQESARSAWRSGSTSAAGRRNQKRPHIPNAMRHKVWQRDKGRCTHDLGDGTLCGDRYMIEIDHLIPWAKNGTHTVENLALKCRRHNLLAAERSFGATFMEQFRNVN